MEKEEEKKPKEEIKEDETIKAIKEEFEAKLKAKDEEFAKKVEEIEAKHIAQLKALISGREEIKKEEESKPKEEEKTLEETIVENLRKKFKV